MRRDGDVVGRKDAVAGMNGECGRRGGRGIRNGGAVKGKGGAKKRPSVETEGRLTIACHMKILKELFCVCCNFKTHLLIPSFAAQM